MNINEQIRKKILFFFSALIEPSEEGEGRGLGPDLLTENYWTRAGREETKEHEGKHWNAIRNTENTI